jgi:predicted DNA-binding transcriptional regulator YafY
MTRTATRLITLIMLLQTKPHQKATELADQLGVSVRTIHRYINMLDEIGIPVYAERGPQGGFSLVRGYKMPPLWLTPEEAVAVYLGTGQIIEMWGELFSEAAQGALAKLENILPDEQLQEIALARQTLRATHMHRADFTHLTPTLKMLRDATHHSQRLVVLYQGRGKTEPTQREVDPYAIVHRWGWWYVVGYCHVRDAVRTFRVDRILELSPLEQTFQRPVSFDLDQYLETKLPDRQETAVVRLHFAPEAALMVHDDAAFWEATEEQPDGAVIVTLITPDLEWAARVALSYGPHAVVLEPPELCDLVYERVRATLAQYNNRPKGEEK